MTVSGRKSQPFVFLAAAERKFAVRRKKVGRAAKESWAFAKNQIFTRIIVESDWSAAAQGDLLCLSCLAFRFTTRIPKSGNMKRIALDIVDDLVKSADNNATVCLFAVSEKRI